MTAETAPCPGCSAPMFLDQEVCGVCRRPRDEAEIAAGKDAVRSRARARRGLPRKLALGAVVAAAAYACFQARGPVLARLARERADMAAEMDRIADPAKRPGGAVPQTEMGKRLVAALARPGAGDVDAPAPSATIALKAPPVAAGEASAPPAAAPAPAAAQPRPSTTAHAPGAMKPNLRKVYGVVYQFSNGLTVPGAEVYVQLPTPSGTPLKGPNAVTDADGYYEIDFNGSSASIADITLIVRLKGEERAIVEESDPPYRERTEQMKSEDLAALREHDPVPVALRFSLDEWLLHRDIVVLPAESAAPGR